MATHHNPDSAAKAKRGPMRMHSTPRAPRLAVPITQEIIDAAERAVSRHCMVSEAIAASVPYAANIISDLATIRFTDADRGLRYTYETPIYVREAIFDFDLGKHVEPFTLSLRNAWVQVSRGGIKTATRMPVASWKALQMVVNDLRKKREIGWKEMATEIGISVGSLTTIFKHKNKLPGSANIDKIEAWAINQTGGKPAARVRTEAHKVAGPEQFRRQSPANRSIPQRVGGRTLPVAASRYRQFGLRAFVRKPRPDTDPQPAA